MTDVAIAAKLTPEEDTFALAVIEHGGNLGAAYRAAFGPDAPMPVARAREMITRPEISKRIQELTIATEEHALVSLGSHIVKLAEIRDLAVDTKQLKVALDAEKARGEVAGFYVSKAAKTKSPGEGAGKASVFINIGSSPSNVGEWGAKHGSTPIVVDVK